MVCFLRSVSKMWARLSHLRALYFFVTQGVVFVLFSLFLYCGLLFLFLSTSFWHSGTPFLMLSIYIRLFTYERYARK